MERALNPKHEKQTIYEIYRACRLCGAGAGYKMPIIQSVVDLEGDGIELKQKIKECVQIEVQHTDRMPPLICELCVDKVNEFYEFLDMCKQNNRRTRLRLGLPLQNRTRDSVDSENCILGVTEPVFNNSDVEHTKKNIKVKNEPVEVKTKTDIEINRKEAVNTNAPKEPEVKRQKGKTKEPDVRAKKEPSRPSPKPEAKPRARESRESSEEPRWSVISRGRRIVRSPSPSPRRTTRQNAELNISPQESFEEPQWTVVSRVRHIARSPTPSPKRTTRQNADLNVTPQLKETPKLQPLQTSLKNVLKKNEESLAIEKSKLKRPREKETKTETQPPNKKAKILSEPVKILKPGPMSSKNVQKEFRDIPVPKLIPKTLAKSVPKKDLKPTPAPTAPKKDLKPTPAPTSKTTPKVSPPKPTPASTPSKPVPSKAKPSKETPFKSDPPYCDICKIYLKTAQGSVKHNNMKHAPTFTSPRHACNACELWFSTVDEANTHHRNHRNHNIPYKCTRCYGYFKLEQAYDDHFGNALCLSVYEVPDVKCWECWRTFPTNKLMEEHRCLGEDGRPGGNCNKCNRSYALLKNLVKHESICTDKKKGEITMDPEVQAQLLPMQVRVAKCDSLLKRKGHVDTSKVSRTYGLDSKCVYPYFTHKVKSEPTTKSFPHMVSINQDVKEEFGDSNTHWDSGSDVSDSSQKQVSTLSTISLKSIFSKKLMSKSPKKHKVDGEMLESSNDFGMGKRIDSIIDTLSNDEAHTSCDSDSILDKDVATTKYVKEQSRDCKKDDGQTSCNSHSILDNNGVRKVEDNKVSDDTVDKSDTVKNDDKAEKHDDIAEKNYDTDEKHDDIAEKNYDTDEKHDDIAEENDDTDEKNDDIAEKNDDTDDKHDDIAEKNDNADEKHDDIAEKNYDTDEKHDDIAEKNDDTDEKHDGTAEKADDIDKKHDDIAEKADDIDKKHDDIAEINDSTPMKFDGSAEKLDSITEKLDDTSEKLDCTSEKLDCTSENHNETSEESDTLQKLDSTLEKPNNTLEKRDSVAETLSETLENPENSNIPDDSEKEPNLNTENDKESVREKDTETIGEDSLSKDEEMPDANTENSNIDSCQIDERNTQHHEDHENNVDDNNQTSNLEEPQIENCPKNYTQLSVLVDSNNQLSNHVSNELLNSNSDNNDNEMDVDEQNDVTDNDNDVINHETAKDSENATEIEENLSKIDEITNKILNENQNLDFNQTSTKTEDLSNVSDDRTSYNDESHPKSDNDSISLNSIGNEIATENQDKFNVNDLNEDDRKLMAELDAQIGENDQETNDNDQSLIDNDPKFRQNQQELINQKAHGDFIEKKTDLITNENDQKQNEQRTKDFLIDNLLKKQDNDLKSLELDSISDDEFNFDI